MTDKDRAQTPGRKANEAQPLGERHGLVSDTQTERTAQKERASAGPDGPDAREVGETFKKTP